MRRMTPQEKETMVQGVLDSRNKEEVQSLKNFVTHHPEEVEAYFKDAAIGWVIKEYANSLKETTVPDTEGVAQELHGMLREKLGLPPIEEQQCEVSNLSRVMMISVLTVFGFIFLLFSLPKL